MMAQRLESRVGRGAGTHTHQTTTHPPLLHHPHPQFLRLGSLDIVDAWPSPSGSGGECYCIVTRPNVFAFVPDPLRSRLRAALAGGALEYADVVTYEPVAIDNPPPYTLTVVSTPPLFAKSARIESTLTIAPAPDAPDTHCIQTLTGVIEFRVGLGLGRAVEGVVIENLKKVYASLPSIVAAWTAFRAEALALPSGGELLLAGRPLNAGVEWIGAAVAALAGADAAVSPGGGGAAAAHLGGGVRVGEDTFFDCAGQGGEEEGGGDAAAAPPSTPAPRSPFAARARLPPPRSWSPARRGATTDSEGSLSLEDAASLRRAGSGGGDALPTPPPPQPPPEPRTSATPSLWFGDAPVPPGAPADRHSARWRAFWRRRPRAVPRGPNVPDAAGVMLSCLAAPADALASLCGECCVGGGVASVSGGGRSADAAGAPAPQRRWWGACLGGPSPVKDDG